MKSSNRILTVLLASGCIASATFFAIPSYSQQRDKALTLEQRVEELEAKVLRQGLYIEMLFQTIEEEKTTALDITGETYSSVANERGTFFFIVDDIRPFLDGHKVSIRVGNATSVPFSSFTLNVTYGPKQSKKEFQLADAAAIQKMQERIRKTSVRSGDALVPTRFAKAEVTLPKTKPEDIGFLRVGIQPEGVLFRTE